MTTYLDTLMAIRAEAEEAVTAINAETGVIDRDPEATARNACIRIENKVHRAKLRVSEEKLNARRARNTD